MRRGVFKALGRVKPIEQFQSPEMSAHAAGNFCVAVPNPMTQRLRFDHANHRLPSWAEESLQQLLSRVRETGNKD